MKKFAFTILALISFGILALAQDEYNTEIIEENNRVLYQNQSRSAGFYFSLSNRIGMLADEESLFVTGQLAFVKSGKAEIGFTGTAFVSDHLGAGTRGDHIYGGYGGMFVAPIIPLSRDLAVTVPLRFGLGAVALDDFDFGIDHNDYDYYYVVEPGATLDYRVARWLKIGAECTYRWTSDISLDNSTLKDLNGFSAGIVLKVGLM